MILLMSPVVCFGAIATGIAFLASTMPGPVTQVTHFNMCIYTDQTEG